MQEIVHDLEKSKAGANPEHFEQFSYDEGSPVIERLGFAEYEILDFLPKI